MDALLSAALLLALAAPVGLAAAWLVVKGPSGLAGFFGPQPGLGWPHGVQEEDPPSWNLSALGRTAGGWAPPGGGTAGRGSVAGTEGGPLNGIFPGDQSLGWPHGVQEEDPVGWNWDHLPAAAPPPSSAEQARALIVERVAFRMGRGSARGGQHGRGRGPLAG
jgi:hypothetical protein